MRLGIFLTLVFLSTTLRAEVLELDYEGFTVWLDCERHGAVKFRYNAQRDTGDQPRSSTFRLDPNVPDRCEQTSTGSYASPEGAPRYDRGHLVPANHLDYSKQAIRESNTMVNILPQTATMNRGAWKHTEAIVECYRDIDELLVLGGVIWGDNPADDYFLDSHGVATPDAFWKVIVRGDGRVIAWVIPNDTEAKYKNLDHYLVPVTKIEGLTGENIPVEPFRKEEVPSTSWQIPIGCDRG